MANYSETCIVKDNIVVHDEFCKCKIVDDGTVTEVCRIYMPTEIKNLTTEFKSYTQFAYILFAKAGTEMHIFPWLVYKKDILIEGCIIDNPNRCILNEKCPHLFCKYYSNIIKQLTNNKTDVSTCNNHQKLVDYVTKDFMERTNIKNVLSTLNLSKFKESFSQLQVEINKCDGHYEIPQSNLMAISEKLSVNWTNLVYCLFKILDCNYEITPDKVVFTLTNYSEEMFKFLLQSLIRKYYLSLNVETTI